MADDPLQAYLAVETSTRLPPALNAIATAARARFDPHALAVLVYGSCLRDGEDRGRLVDLYVLVDSYRGVHRTRTMRLLNALIPPNVYYLEAPFKDRTVRAKIALLTLDQLEAWVAPSTDQPYFWSRFSQPTVIAWTQDATVHARVLALLAQAIRTAGGHALALGSSSGGAEALWARLFAATYATELRAEPPERSQALVQGYGERFAAIMPMAGATAVSPRGWRRRRVLGKLWSIARLVKAGYTFQGGAAYLAYKIERHSGVVIELTPWEHRHPVLAGFRLFWRYRRLGAFR